mmetsp:Transcript_11803/g.17013  ORF Transcript_11803/g.17013 Transcript_11803/m.17013 type:complete len:316 (-) Transcript_11803:688-1635(-)
MGNLFSAIDAEDGSMASTDDSSDDGRTAKPVALTTTAFGTFDGAPERWIPFKDKVLGQAGAAGYDAFFKATCVITKKNRAANKRIFYLLKLATTGGGASALVSRHEEEQDGYAAWASLKDYYEGTIAAGEAAKLTRAKLFNLRLRAKDNPVIHMNDFNRYTDQLTKLNRPETEETLVDLFLDSILDDKFEVAVNLCKQLKYTTVAQCMEAIRFKNNTSIRDDVVEQGDTLQKLRAKIRRLEGDRKQPVGEPEPSPKSATKTGPGRYYSYKDWNALTPEARKAAITARGSSTKTARRAKTKSNPNTIYPSPKPHRV